MTSWEKKMDQMQAITAAVQSGQNTLHIYCRGERVPDDALMEWNRLCGSQMQPQALVHVREDE